jgi:hypothetical protein
MGDIMTTRQAHASTILLGNHEFSRIDCGHSSFDLTKINYKTVICRDCKKDINPRMGIHRRAYSQGGYICLGCLRCHLIIAATTREGDGDRGFRMNAISHQIQICTLNKRSWTTRELISAIGERLLDLGADHIDNLLGDETPGPWHILDAAEAYVGRI